KVVGKGVKAVTGAGKWAGKKIASAHKAVKGAFKKSPTDTDRFNQFVKFRSKQGGGRSAI
ncbi:MAG: hypothetical protein H8D97_01150, partial [Proteobacteria bacterium]|nr:hypothetical protein [Pseudomonadota bacterium]